MDQGSSRFDVKTVERPSDVEQEWRQLEGNGVTTVFQRYDWIDAYIRHVLPHEKARPAIVLGRLHGRPAFILPLAISRTGPVRIATWIGGKHSGYNFGLWSAEAIAAMAPLTRRDVETMLASALDADCAVLTRTPQLHDGVAHPLGRLPRSPSSTEGYAFELTGGFQAVLKRTDGAGRRRGVRTKERRLGEAGGVEYLTSLDPAHGHAALEFFFEQKALRLAEQGKPNSFDEPGVKDFFRDLVGRSQAMDEPLLEMTALSVGGKMRAVRGAGIHRGRLNGYFMTFARDELVSHSPGHVLLFRHIEACCERGMAVYDCGVGYEDYKMSWCDIVIELDDAYAAFTPLGSAMIATIRLSHAMKARARQNNFLWRRLKTMQALLRRSA
ncbi:GNAT family N-acetyltransferase [Mesorhizobium sp. ES1-1]|nr:GNAT family N-acetyltransferase [Mesorhizobium sp. ES1-1]